MGALTTAMFFVYMLAAPLTGWLGDRFSRKPLIIAGAILWSLATLGTVWVHSYWTFYMRQGFVGIGEATFSIFAPSVLADFYPERDRNANPFDLLSRNSSRSGSGLPCGRGNWKQLGLADAVFCMCDSWPGDRGALCGLRARAGAGFVRSCAPTADRATVSGFFAIRRS